MSIVTFLDKTFYPEYENNWDDKLMRKEVLSHINKDFVVLDIGAGAGILPEMNFKGFAKEVYGVDPDERVKDNPYLNKSYVGLGDDMPYLNDETFNVVIANNVLEHVGNPDVFFKEVNRVLKKGGVLITKTPNKYHYVPMLARLTSTTFHKFYNKIRGRDAEDTFPTLYKVNSIKDQEKIAKRTGFKIHTIKAIEGRPEYLRIFALTYLFGILYERLVNLFNAKFLKVILITVYKKE